MRLAVSTRTSQGLFSAYETRRMIGRPIAKENSGDCKPDDGVGWYGDTEKEHFNTKPKEMAARLSGG